MSTQPQVPFQQRLHETAEEAVLSFLTNPGNWLMPDYKSRCPIPADWIAAAWALVDREAIQRALAQRIEQELADRIMNHLAAEMATDVKRLLSNEERREALRAVARQHLDAICGAGKGSTS